MPFGRRRPRAPRKTRVPKVSSVVQYPKPKIGNLVRAYKKLVTASVPMQIAALSEAIGWFDVAVPYALSQNPTLGQSADMQKTYNRANGARNLGINTGATEPEREVALRTAVHLYEKIVRESKTIPKLPVVDAYYQKVEAMRGKLEASLARLTGKFDGVVAPLSKAFEPTGIGFAVADAEKARQFDGTGRIIFSREYAQQLLHQVRREGIVPLLLGQLRTVLTASAVEVVDGSHVVKLDKILPMSQIISEAWIAYLTTVPPRLLVRNVTKVAGPGVLVSNGQQSEKQVSRQGHIKRQKGEKVGGMYASGSAMAVIWERLQDGQFHRQADVINGLPCADPAMRLQSFAKDLRHNFWRVEFKGDVVRMVYPSQT